MSKKKHMQERTDTREPTAVSQKVNTNRLPTHLETGRAIMPSAQPGYYPGYSTLKQQAFWDEATRKVVLDRVEKIPPLRFFSDPGEAALMRAVCDRLLPQDDRDDEHKISLINYIDEKLYLGKSEGYRYEDMPSDGEAIHLGLRGIDVIARKMYNMPFVELGPLERDAVLQTLHDNNPPAGDEIWQRVAVPHLWLFLMNCVIEAYYAHPYAWDEVGFGGPAYPRGYFRLEGGRPEPWEVEEQRYEWRAPNASLSDSYRPLGGPGKHKQQMKGQGGTH